MMSPQLKMDAEYGVIGLGAIGSFIVKQLSDKGASVIGIDRFSPPHDQGSTHGDTRLIREAYSEDSRYVPILQRSMSLWRDLNKEMSQTVFHETGVNYLGPKDQFRILATRASAKTYNLTLSPSNYDDETTHKQFSAPKSWDFFHETRAGYLHVEPVLEYLLKKSAKQGVTLLQNTAVERIENRENRWEIRCSGKTITVNKLIICAGAWSQELLPFIKPLITLERHTLHWFESLQGSHTYAAGFRPFTVHTPEDDWFYGFPEDQKGHVKIAEHNEGARFKRVADIDRRINPADIERVTTFKNKFLPSLGEIKRSTSCMYTMTPDCNFIIDHIPDKSNGVLIAGLSGHGYKFAPALAEIAIGQVNKQESDYDLSMFALNRFENLG